MDKAHRQAAEDKEDRAEAKREQAREDRAEDKAAAKAEEKAKEVSALDLAKEIRAMILAPVKITDTKYNSEDPNASGSEVGRKLDLLIKKLS